MKRISKWLNQMKVHLDCVILNGNSGLQLLLPLLKMLPMSGGFLKCEDAINLLAGSTGWNLKHCGMSVGII